MVSPRLLLTNNHVLRSKADALHSEIEFDYQTDRNGCLLPIATYSRRPAVPTRLRWKRTPQRREQPTGCVRDFYGVHRRRCNAHSEVKGLLLNQ